MMSLTRKEQRDTKDIKVIKGVGDADGWGI